jgi:hypothetical protein
MKYARATFLVFIIVITGTACSLERESSLDANPTQPTPSSGGGGQGGGMLGTWASPAEIPTLDPKSCNFFEWKVSSQTTTQISGQFSAVCMTNVVISGNASGQLTSPTTITFTVSGSANLPSAPGCTFSASGDGTIEGNEALHLRFSGTSCLGPFSGSSTLRRPAPAEAPPPPPPPAPEPPPPPPPGPEPWENCGSLTYDKLALVRCVHDAIDPGRSADRAFEVTKRVAWLLRGEGGGLLIKDSGENIMYWQGYWFSLSRICFPDGHIIKVLTDAGEGGTNGPAYNDDGFVDPRRWVPAIDPNR